MFPLLKISNFAFIIIYLCIFFTDQESLMLVDIIDRDYNLKAGTETEIYQTLPAAQKQGRF